MAATSSVKTYRLHRCKKNHRSYRKWAKCTWRYAEWITGEGEYALLTHCRVLAITLWPTLESALADPMMNGHPCGGMCNRRHEVIRIRKG